MLIVALVFFAIAARRRASRSRSAPSSGGCIAVGAVCIVAAWFYTGGKRPYGYYGLGELFVFVFFGLVATLGTTWVQAFALPQEAWFGAVGAGLLACAVLLANNLRDIDQDRKAGKRTLTVLIGRTATRWLFTVFVLAAFVIAVFLALFYPIAWLTLLVLLAGAAGDPHRLDLPRPARTRRRPRPHLAHLGRLRRVPVLGVHRLTDAAARGIRISRSPQPRGGPESRLLRPNPACGARRRR